MKDIEPDQRFREERTEEFSFFAAEIGKYEFNECFTELISEFLEYRLQFFMSQCFRKGEIGYFFPFIQNEECFVVTTWNLFIFFSVTWILIKTYFYLLILPNDPWVKVCEK